MTFIAANNNAECIRVETTDNILNVTMSTKGRNMVSPTLIREYRQVQRLVSANPGHAPDWLVARSDDPFAFNLGGDLEYFSKCIRSNDRQQLAAYAHSCIDVMMDNINGLNSNVVTVAIVDGDALGGGFELALTFDFLIATPRARFGLPEINFGLFPGMGAHALLVNKVGSSTAAKMINEGKTYSAKEMFDEGVVTHLASDNDAEQVLDKLIRTMTPRLDAYLSAKAAMKVVAPVDETKMRNVVEIWTDTAMRINTRNLRFMEKIVDRQDRKVAQKL